MEALCHRESSVSLECLEGEEDKCLELTCGLFSGYALEGQVAAGNNSREHVALTGVYCSVLFSLAFFIKRE